MPRRLFPFSPGCGIVVLYRLNTGRIFLQGACFMPTRRERPPGFFWVLRQLVVRYFRHQVGRSAAELS